MEEKLLFGTDYDETYRLTGDRPAKSDIAAAREFRKRGNLFGIVTGRDVYEVMEIIGHFEGEYDFVLCSTGSACLLRDGTFLWREGTDGEYLPTLYGICKSHGTVHTHTDITGTRGSLRRIAADLPGCTVLYYDGELHSVRVGEKSLSLVTGFTQFTAYFPAEDAAKSAMAEIREQSKGTLTCHSLGNGFDVTAANVNKAAGLRRVAKHFGIPERCIWTAGDSFNDVEMLSAFNGIAMESGIAEAKSAAKYTASCVAESLELALA